MSERPRWARTLWMHVVDMMPDEDREDDETLDRIEQVVKDDLCVEFGHEIIDDQCNRPEHRFCVYCTRMFPNAEVSS